MNTQSNDNFQLKAIATEDGFPFRAVAQHTFLRQVVTILPVLLPLVIFLVTGFQGLDFGYHWDEQWHLKGLTGSIQDGVLLPGGFYDYPSVSYWLHILGALPYFVSAIATHWPDTEAIKQVVINDIHTHTFNLRVRGIFLILSSLSVVWVYLLVLSWRKRWIEALLAASIVGFSWEVNYHSRWIAPDVVMAQFGALTLLCLTLAQIRPSKKFWLRLGAVAAGLTCGTKYPAGLLIVPLSIAAYQWWVQTPSSRWRFVRFLAELWVIFGTTYLLTTPGTLFDFPEFYHDVYISDVLYYQTGHFGYTIHPGLEGLWRILLYLSTTLLSHFQPLSMMLFALVLVGSFALIKESRQKALLYLSFPVLYVLYFSMQRVMIVRNFMVLTPFLAVLAAYGAAFLVTLVRWSMVRTLLTGFLALMVAFNAYWLFYAAQTIVTGGTDGYWLVYSGLGGAQDKATKPYRDLSAYIDAHPKTQFFLSNMVRSSLATLSDTEHPNVIDKPAQQAIIVFFASEGMDMLSWPANDPFFTLSWFGPYEVNFNYYPTWSGSDRILLMTYEKAHASGVLLVK